MVIIIMGVTGAGKSTIGRLLAAKLGWPFFDADDFHPKANVEKMHSGRPLTDADRAPWLAALRVLITDYVRQGRDAIIACSALKAEYRARLRVDAQRVVFVYLTGDPALIRTRLAARQGHFMPPALLDSQMALLEPPTDGVCVDVTLTPAMIVENIREALRLGVSA
jgi:gluconokinase